MMKSLILLIGLIFLLVGCEKPINSGTITNKFYEPERRWTSQGFFMVGKIMIPQTYHHFDDEDFVIIFEGKNEKDLLKYRRLEVTQSEYNRQKIGDYIKLKEDE